MIKSCTTGDPQMDLASMSGAAPENATKKTHGPIRELYKTCNFGTLYGQGIWGLARQIKGTPIEARELQDHHRKRQGPAVRHGPSPAGAVWHSRRAFSRDPPMAEPVPFPQPEAPRQHELLSGDTMLKTFAYAKQHALFSRRGLDR
jgi:hypothetical protein